MRPPNLGRVLLQALIQRAFLGVDARCKRKCPIYHWLLSDFPGDADHHNARDRGGQNLNRYSGGSADLMRPLSCRRNAMRSLDDKYRFVVHAIFLAKLPEDVILADCVCQNRIANCFRGLILMLTDNLLDLQSILLVAAIVNSVCIEEQDVSEIHQLDIRNFR